MQMQTTVVVFRCSSLPCNVHIRAARQTVQVSLGRLVQEDTCETQGDTVLGHFQRHAEGRLGKQTPTQTQ